MSIPSANEANILLLKKKTKKTQTFWHPPGALN